MDSERLWQHSWAIKLSDSFSQFRYLCARSGWIPSVSGSSRARETLALEAAARVLRTICSERWATPKS